MSRAVAGSKTFMVIPAVDLRGGRCVRLWQGRPELETSFSGDPAAVARRWEKAGATALHVIDLDGAFGGGPRNLDALEQILDAVSIPVQFVGGIRDAGCADRVMAMGVSAVVVSTAALAAPAVQTSPAALAAPVAQAALAAPAVQTSPARPAPGAAQTAPASAPPGAILRELLARYPGAVVPSLDVRDGAAVVDGWTRASGLRATEAAALLLEAGARRAVVTDVSRDGTLRGPNPGLAAEVAATGLEVLAAGGISSAGDIAAMAAVPGVVGVIVGRALYTGDLRLEDAIRAARRGR